MLYHHIGKLIVVILPPPPLLLLHLLLLIIIIIICVKYCSLCFLWKSLLRRIAFLNTYSSLLKMLAITVGIVTKAFTTGADISDTFQAWRFVSFCVSGSSLLIWLLPEISLTSVDSIFRGILSDLIRWNLSGNKSGLTPRYMDVLMSPFRYFVLPIKSDNGKSFWLDTLENAAQSWPRNIGKRW